MKSTQQADTALAPLIEYASHNPGTIARVTERMCKLTGKNVHRQLVESWLHVDPEKRVEPRLSTGLLLLKLWQQMKAKRDVDKMMAAAKKDIITYHEKRKA